MARIQLDVHPFTDRGRREHQEDFFYTDPPERDGVPWLGGLADGMGGHACGDVASKAGIHAMKQAFDAAVAGRHNTLDALIGAVTEGHQAVLQAAEREKAVGNMGSTIVAFAVEGRTLYWCSAGDSRLTTRARWAEGESKVNPDRVRRFGIGHPRGPVPVRATSCRGRAR